MKKQNIYKRSCNYKKTSNTLDFCHKNNVDKFSNERTCIQNKYHDLKEYENKLSSIQSKPNSEKSDEDFVNLVIYKDKIKQIQKDIDNIQSYKYELEYYTKTADILYNYYELVENNSDDSMDITTHLNNANSLNKKTILEYFHKPCSNYDDNANQADKQATHLSINVSSNQTNTVVNVLNSNNLSTNNNRASLLDEYLAMTDMNYINDNIDNNIALKCDHCGSMDKTVLNNDSISVCNCCHSVQHLLTDNEKPSYKDPPKEISYFSYKRINHYQEWLNQIQGKETTDIPEEVFDKIMLELKKQRIMNTKEINRQKIKEILKKLKINKYYEHIPYILNRITGIPNPNLTPELEETLRNMFKEIQVPFLKHSPLIRKNFLSYSYVIHKFIQILEKDEYLKYFPLLKSREKLHQQEEIWKKICQDLGWKFIRSI